VYLAPKQQNGITQMIRLTGVQRGQGSNVKMRWKAAYFVSGAKKDEMGEIPSLGVS
jgi:ADP-ribosylation factor-binding protein GGA